MLTYFIATSRRGRAFNIWGARDLELFSCLDAAVESARERNENVPPPQIPGAGWTDAYVVYEADIAGLPFDVLDDHRVACHGPIPPDRIRRIEADEPPPYRP